ncbi:hypothetical protein [Streptomyces sp. 061-3]|uniref:hypothetical protein n=1 Tax=Streptomyces sp. 061-3 TaxID=2789268 RepID=UPI00398144C3
MLASAAAVTAAVVAVAVAVPLLDSGKDDVRLTSEMNPSDIIAHPDQTPPGDLIAAGASRWSRTTPGTTSSRRTTALSPSAPTGSSTRRPART